MLEQGEGKQGSISCDVLLSFWLFFVLVVLFLLTFFAGCYFLL